MLDITINEENEMSYEEWLIAEGHKDESLTDEEWEQILSSTPEELDE